MINAQFVFVSFLLVSVAARERRQQVNCLHSASDSRWTATNGRKKKRKYRRARKKASERLTLSPIKLQRRIDRGFHFLLRRPPAKLRAATHRTPQKLKNVRRPLAEILCAHLHVTGQLEARAPKFIIGCTGIIRMRHGRKWPSVCLG